MNLDYDAMVKDVCSKDFFEFVKEFWSEISSERPVWNWHTQYICSTLQRSAERVFREEKSPYDIVLNVPPGMTKSTIVSEMFPAWCWTRKPHMQFICGSYKFDIAYDLARRTKNVVTSGKYQRCFPDVGNFKEPKASETTSMLVNKHGGFRLAVGQGGATGLHAHFILIDDPMDPNQAASEKERENAVRWTADMLSTRKVNKDVAVTVMVMQRLHQADPAALMLDQMEDRKWGHKVKHICLPWKASERVRPKKLVDRYIEVEPGLKLLDPIRLSKTAGMAYKSKLGTFGFSCQFDQSPVPDEGGFFDTSRIQFEKPPETFMRVVRSWDKAGTIAAGDYTAGVKMALDLDGRVWVLDCKRGQWESGKRERLIRQIAQFDGDDVPIMIEREPGSGGKESAENTIRRTLLGFNARSELPTGEKSARADPFSAQVNDGNVFIPTGSAWAADYLDELKYFPVGEHDDMVDASSQAFNYLMRKKTLGAAFGADGKFVAQIRNKGKLAIEQEVSIPANVPS